jgi:hypothetical protein
MKQICSKVSPNRAGKTRISFDFRLVLKEDYDEKYLKVSKLTGKKFIIGEYYSFFGGSIIK